MTARRLCRKVHVGSFSFSHLVSLVFTGSSRRVSQDLQTWDSLHSRGSGLTFGYCSGEHKTNDFAARSYWFPRICVPKCQNPAGPKRPCFVEAFICMVVKIMVLFWVPSILGAIRCRIVLRTKKGPYFWQPFICLAENMWFCVCKAHSSNPNRTSRMRQRRLNIPRDLNRQVSTTRTSEAPR